MSAVPSQAGSRIADKGPWSIAQRASVPARVAVCGELVPCERVPRRASQAEPGPSAADRRQTAALTPLLLISLHGFSDAQRRRVQDANRELLDPSCLRLRHILRAALELQAEGRRVLLIGNSGDAEVQRIVEQLVNGDVIEHPHDVRCWESRELGIVCQGSVPPAVFAEICSHIQLCNPLADIRMVDTVQDPVQRRQRVLRELLGMVDAVVVAGERDSSNSPRIVQLCHEHLTPAVHVGCADELDPEWFSDVETVGLTVGGATTVDTIDRVRHRLEEIVAKRRG